MTKEPAGTKTFADVSSQGSMLKFGALSSKIGKGSSLAEHTSDATHMDKGPVEPKL